jgi:hypothetical protein
MSEPILTGFSLGLITKLVAVASSFLLMVSFGQFVFLLRLFPQKNFFFGGVVLGFVNFTVHCT